MRKRQQNSESRSIALPQITCDYQLKRSNARRTLALSVGKQGLVVHAPWSLPLMQIEQFMLDKSTWIWAKLQAQTLRTASVWSWYDGMPLRYLGIEIRLHVSAHCREIALIDGILQVPELSAVKVLRWYRQAAMAVFQQRLAVFATQLTRLPVLRLTNARTRWGSCTSAGVVRLHWRLVQASVSEIDYVLAHELAHLTYMNHSPQFWQRVAELYPVYQQPHRRLREQGHVYHQMVAELSVTNDF
jgi:hypothetical protein